MPIFKYKAYDQDKKIIKSKMVAFNENDVYRKLSKRELTPIEIRDITDNLEEKINILLNRVAVKDLVIFSRQFAVMVSSNISLVESLTTIVDQTENMKLKMIISEVAYDVDSGSQLSDALGKHKVFSDFFVNVVKSGETSGKLDEVLNYMANEMEKDYDMSKKITGAFIYPAFVVAGLGAVGVIMMVYVLPQLTGIIVETGAELPMATKIVVWVSDFLRNYFVYIIAVIIGAGVGLRYFYKTEAGRFSIDSLKLRLPVFGSLFKTIYLIRFCRSLSTLLKGGVPLIKSLEVTLEIVSNDVFKRLIRETILSVNEGHPISYDFERSDAIPKMVPQMMTIGEKTGKLDDILDKITGFYAREVDNKLANLTTLLEPIIMVVMGVGVGIMVAAVIMPMYSVATSF